MRRLLIPLALWLGAVGVGVAELTEAQRRGLQVALEEFHKHPPVQWAFQETGVDSAVDTVSKHGPGGSREARIPGDQRIPRKRDRSAWALSPSPLEKRPQSNLLGCDCVREARVTPGLALHAQLVTDHPLPACLQHFPAGIFVRLEFKLQQTSCRKRDWKKPECKVRPNGVSEGV